jgi:hypothetical protein
MTTKVLKLEITKIPANDSAGNPLSDQIGARIDKAYQDHSMAGFALVAAYETQLATDANPSPTGPTHIMLYFQKP